MKKPLLILAISASFIAGTMVAGNFVFADPEDSQNSLLDQILSAIQAQEPICPVENAQHWNKIIFELDSPLTHPTDTTLNLPAGTEIEVLVQVDPNFGHPVGKLIVDKLTGIGYSDIDITRDSIRITYSTICAEN